MPIPPTLEASFVALATDTAALITAERAAWKHEDEVLGLQMMAMEETIALLQKEVKVTAAQLEPFQQAAPRGAAESSRDESSPARAAACSPLNTTACCSRRVVKYCANEGNSFFSDCLRCTRACSKYSAVLYAVKVCRSTRRH